MKKSLFLAMLLMVGGMSMTSCLNEDDEPLPLPVVESPAVTTVQVMDNPSYLAVVNNVLFINGYGTSDWNNILNPLQVYDPRSGAVVTVPNVRVTSMAPMGDRLLMVDSESPNWVNYTTTIQTYDVATNTVGGDCLSGAPASLYTTAVYGVRVNPGNGHIYVTTTDFQLQTTIYHFDADGAFVGVISGCGASAKAAAFDSEGNAYFVSEGKYQMNNSTIYRVAYGEDTAVEFYAAANGGKMLGDTGNDILMASNGALYVVVNGSSYIARLAADGRETRRYACGEKDGAPRFIVEHGGLLYVSTYGGKVLCLNENLEKQGELALGTALEQMAVIGDDLYVLGCNMGYDNRLFVIDPSRAFVAPAE